MLKWPLLFIVLIASTFFLYGGEKEARLIAEINNQVALRALESRKLDLEEKRLYLSMLQGSRITEEKARELSAWILRNLKDYPQGKKAKNVEEDIRTITQAIAAVLKPNSN